LDFPEDELPPPVVDRINASLDLLGNNFDRLIATWDEGHLLRDGALVVISGKPNVGKSTFLNALLEVDRAIVSDIAGTTRDTIEEEFILNGIPIRLVDTAGLRDTEDVIEQAGIGRTRDRMAQADLHIHLIDLSEPCGQEAAKYVEGLDPARTLIVGNKLDLATESQDLNLPGFELVRTSLIDRENGIVEVKQAMTRKLAGDLDLAARPHAVISERHRRLLVDARNEIQVGVELLASNQEDHLVLAASQMRLAVELVGEATGKEYQEELLDSIFSQFCIGK
jgi:tRNA modification GTPase